MNQIKNILSSYFQRPGAAADPLAIAKGPVLLNFANTLVTLLLTIKTLILTVPQRQKMSGKGGTGQRQRSQAFQEFLAKRQDFAAQTQVDPTILQQVIDKDESFDTLAYVAAALIQYFNGAELQLAAYLSQEGGKVLAFLQQQQQDDTVPLKDLAPLAVTFVPVEIEAGKQNLTALGRAQRQARAAQAAQTALQAKQAQIGKQQQIGQLTQAARSGAGNLPLQAPQTKSHSKKGA